MPNEKKTPKAPLIANGERWPKFNDKYGSHGTVYDWKLFLLSKYFTKASSNHGILWVFFKQMRVLKPKALQNKR